MQNKQKDHIHFIGIGGSSMSGLAELALKQGYTVSGSDRTDSDKLNQLKQKGINIFTYHAAENISADTTLVVYTLAVPQDNPELSEARRRNIPTVERGVYLGQICSQYKYSVAVAGTHGKTSTTSMLSSILLSAEKKPNIHIGGFFPRIGSNVLASDSDYFITEACEYHENFLNLHTYGQIILNVEAEHLDYYKDLSHIMNAFSEFASYCNPEGFLVVCCDDRNAVAVSSYSGAKIITYSIKDKSAIYFAENIRHNGIGCTYTLCENQKSIADINLHVPGTHNVSNSLAAAAAAISLGCSIESVKDGLETFFGTGRRFEKKGEYNGIPLIDDYAHHPTEIYATLSAARGTIPPDGKIYAIFQPHTYSRIQSFLEDFSKALKLADHVIVTDIYSAREKDPGTISGASVADYFAQNGINAIHISDFKEIADRIRNTVHKNDIVLTLGAGDVNHIIPLISV